MVVVVAEVDTDRARHDLLVAYSLWSGAPRERAIVVRGALVNDVACLRLGVPLLAEAARSGSFLRGREEGPAAAWSLVVAIGVDQARVGAKEKEAAEAIIDARAGDLVRELRRRGRGRVSLLDSSASSRKAVERLPLVLRCLPATELVQAWFDGTEAAWSRAAVDVYRGTEAASTLRLHVLGDAMVTPWGETLFAKGKGASDAGAATLPRGQRRSLWRIYRQRAEGTAAAREASGALVDGSRPAFEAQELELAWVTPLGGFPAGHRHELIGTAHLGVAARSRLERAFAVTDGVASNLHYEVVQAERQGLPMSLLSRQGAATQSLGEGL